MNVLYFDQKDLWSPKIDDMDDEFDINIEDEQYHSINHNQISQGKWLTLWVTPITSPEVSVPRNIGEE